MAVRTLEETERNKILKILSETRWRIEGKDGTAAILGPHPSTLRARIHKIGIVRPETRRVRLISCLTLLNVSLNILRFHQILRLNESFHTFLLFSPVNLTTYY